MNQRDKKLDFLRELSKESEPISLSALLDKIQLDHAKRTIRRWLNSLIDEGLVKKIGHTKSAKYIAIKSNEKANDRISSCFGSRSLLIIKKVHQPLYKRNPVAYDDKWFNK